MKSLPTALATIACVLAVPAAAEAAFPLGQHPDGVLPGTSTPCPAGCTLVQDRNANETLRVPERGVVVRWIVRGNGQARLRRVVVNGTSGTAGAATAPVQLTGATQEIPASLPVNAGDALGVEVAPGGSLDSVELGFGETLLAWSPALGEGATAAGTATDGAVVAYQALIEPDADGDGLGDESQDSCVNCGGGGGGTTPPPGGENPPPAETDPYAEVRAKGPSATIAAQALRKGRKVSVTVTNPYAFELTGKLQLKRGRKVVAKAKLKLAANASRTLKLKVRKPGRKLTAVATLKAPVGAAKATTKQLKVTTTKPPKPGKGGIDGTYRGSGAGADWVMIINKGIVTNFNGSITVYCTKAGEQQSHTFAMIGDDPDPSVAADGSFAWEATSGYGFDKLKFDGVVKGGKVTGKMVAESRPLIQGTSPVSGLPRLEPEYCFAGREYTLTRG